MDELKRSLEYSMFIANQVQPGDIGYREHYSETVNYDNILVAQSQASEALETANEALTEVNALKARVTALEDWINKLKDSFRENGNGKLFILTDRISRFNHAGVPQINAGHGLCILTPGSVDPDINGTYWPKVVLE